MACAATPTAARITPCGSSRARPSRRRSSSSTRPRALAATRASGSWRCGSCCGTSSTSATRWVSRISRGVLHRDLKPANIMLGPYGETLVVDWGLAKPIDRSEDAPDRLEAGPIWCLSESDLTLTETGAALGTPQYMSPEQAEGRWDEVGPASDLYSLGATLYTLLSGHSPFAHSSDAVVPPADRARRDPAAPDSPPGSPPPACPGGDLPQGDGAEAGGPVRLGSRPGRGPRALAGRRAGRGGSRGMAPAAGAVGPAAPVLDGGRHDDAAAGHRGLGRRDAVPQERLARRVHGQHPGGSPTQAGQRRSAIASRRNATSPGCRRLAWPSTGPSTSSRKRSLTKGCSGWGMHSATCATPPRVPRTCDTPSGRTWGACEPGSIPPGNVSIIRAVSGPRPSAPTARRS